MEARADDRKPSGTFKHSTKPNLVTVPGNTGDDARSVPGKQFSELRDWRTRNER